MCLSWLLLRMKETKTIGNKRIIKMLLKENKSEHDVCNYSIPHVMLYMHH